MPELKIDSCEEKMPPTDAEQEEWQAAAIIEGLTAERDYWRLYAGRMREQIAGLTRERDEAQREVLKLDRIQKERTLYWQRAKVEIDRLTRERDEAIKSSDAVCNSYAIENQRLFDRAEAAEREQDEARKRAEFAEDQHEVALKDRDAAEAASAQAREALRDLLLAVNNCVLGCVPDNWVEVIGQARALARDTDTGGGDGA